MTQPICAHCRQPFGSRRDLLVLAVGRGGLAAVHPGCRGAYTAALPWFLRGTGTVNRPAALVWLLGFNLLFGGWFAVAQPADRTPVLAVWVVANLWLAAQRGVAWWCYERHLPAAGSHLRGAAE